MFRVALPTVPGALLAAALTLAAATPCQGQWPQWRGPERDGTVPSGGAPDRWPSRLELVWEREVGQGHSGPISDGQRGWIHTRRGENEVVSSLHLADGKLGWSREYPAPFKQDESARAHGTGPYSTPSLAGGRLFTLGVRAVLSVWGAGAGDLLWRADYSKELTPSYPYFGAAASPLVWGGLCFVHFGGPGGGDPGRGAMVALRVSDGSEVWRWAGEGPALGASPVVREIAGRHQLVFKTQAMIVGLDPPTGQELWRIPFKVAMDNTIVTPLFAGDRLLTSDYQAGMHAWRILPGGEGWTVRELWKNPAVSLFTSSPVLAARQLVGFSDRHRGQLFGLDPADGEVRWRGPPRWGEHVSLMARGNEVLAFREDGSLVVGVVSTRGFRPLQTYRVGRSMTWAHPAIVDGRIIVKGQERIAVYAAHNR